MRRSWAGQRSRSLGWSDVLKVSQNAKGWADLGRAGVGSAYGAAGSLAVLLVWLYYATQIFLFGAELTKAYATQMGSRIKPKKYAESVTAEARAQEGLAAKPGTTDGQPAKQPS